MLTKFLWGGGKLSIPLQVGDVGNDIKIYFRGITPCCKEADRRGQGPCCRTGVSLC